MSFRFEAFLRRFSSTVDPWEVKKFRNLSVGWENQDSVEYALLRRINPLRLGYLQTHVSDLKGKRLLDVGCGGGLLSLVKVVSLEYLRLNISYSHFPGWGRM